MRRGRCAQSAPMHGLLNGWCKRLTLEGLLRLKEGFDERVDIRFGVITRERNADRAVDDGGGKMQSLEHMAAVALGAGGTGGDVDSFCLQAVDDALRAKAREGEIYDVRRVLLSRGRGREFAEAFSRQRSRSCAIWAISAAASVSSQAAAKPQIPGRFSVPERKFPSCPPPMDEPGEAGGWGGCRVHRRPWAP